MLVSRAIHIENENVDLEIDAPETATTQSACLRASLSVMSNTEMQNSSLKKVTFSFSFFSSAVAWTVMNIYYSVSQAWEDGVANDIQVIISWSALYILLAWILFNWPLRAINHSYELFKPYYFPFLSGVIGTLFYAILIGGEFDYYMPLGTIAGFIFGLSYSLLIHSKKLVSLFAVRPVYKLGLFLSPILFLVMFLCIFPAVTPKYAYRYMPDGIQHKIFANTISKFKTGDNFKDLVRALPYYFDDHSEAKKTRSFSSSGGGPLIDYDLVVSNDTIVKLVINNKGK